MASDQSYNAAEVKGQTEEKKCNMMDTMKDKTQEAKDKTYDAAGAAKDKTIGTTHEGKDKTYDAAGAAKDKTIGTTHEGKDKTCGTTEAAEDKTTCLAHEGKDKAHDTTQGTKPHAQDCKDETNNYISEKTDVLKERAHKTAELAQGSTQAGKEKSGGGLEAHVAQVTGAAQDATNAVKKTLGLGEKCEDDKKCDTKKE